MSKYFIFLMSLLLIQNTKAENSGSGPSEVELKTRYAGIIEIHNIKYSDILCIYQDSFRDLKTETGNGVEGFGNRVFFGYHMNTVEHAKTVDYLDVNHQRKTIEFSTYGHGFQLPISGLVSLIPVLGDGLVLITRIPEGAISYTVASIDANIEMGEEEAKIKSIPTCE